MDVKPENDTRNESEIAADERAEAYNNAMRDVDLSYLRKENAGNAYSAKADEMKNLGDYNDAEELAAEYEKKAELLSVAENKQTARLTALSFSEIMVAAVTAILTAVIIPVVGTTIGYAGAEYASSVVMAVIGAALCIIGAVLGRALIKKVRYDSKRRSVADTCERALLAAACALMFVPTVMAYMNIGLYGTLYLVLCITSLAALVFAMLRQQFANSDLKDTDVIR